MRFLALMFLSYLFFTSFAFLGSFAQDIPVVLPPWTLNISEGYVFVTPPLLTTALLPAGFAEAPEAEAMTSDGFMTPDIGQIIVTRYSASPAGPYDELIYIPGKWAYSNPAEAGFRITRIYVSTNESVFNGRANWNIPKHLGVFDFQTDDLGATTVSVSSPDSDEPFFGAKFTPTTADIPIEVNSTLLTGNFLTLTQPPIPAGTTPAEVGTDTWKELLLSGVTSSASANLIEGTLGGGKIGDGVGYPDIQPLLPVGVKVTGTLIFPVATEFDSV